jgi:hypothetical protein
MRLKSLNCVTLLLRFCDVDIVFGVGRVSSRRDADATGGLSYARARIQQ